MFVWIDANTVIDEDLQNFVIKCSWNFFYMTPEMPMFDPWRVLKTPGIVFTVLAYMVIV